MPKPCKRLYLILTDRCWLNCSADLKAGLFKESEIKASPNGNKAIKNAKQQTAALYSVVTANPN